MRIFSALRLWWTGIEPSERFDLTAGNRHESDLKDPAEICSSRIADSAIDFGRRPLTPTLELNVTDVEYGQLDHPAFIDETLQWDEQGQPSAYPFGKTSHK